MIPQVEPGLYHDSFEPRGPVEVLGEGVLVHSNCRLVAIRVPGERVLEFVRPAEFFQDVTVKNGDGTAGTVRRFTPAGPAP